MMRLAMVAALGAAAMFGCGDGGSTNPLHNAGSNTICDDPLPPVVDYTGDYTLEWKCIGQGPTTDFPSGDCDPDKNPLLAETSLSIGESYVGNGGLNYRHIELGPIVEEGQIAPEDGSLTIFPGTDGGLRRTSAGLLWCKIDSLWVEFQWEFDDQLAYWMADGVPEP
jgi:hypothetical protein